MTVCMSGGATSEFSGRLRYDPNEKSSRLPVKDSNPSFDDGIPGRRSTLQNKVNIQRLGHISEKLRRYRC